jgi:mannose-6-phosphate isomerase-like protein (cupin superfamily)
MNDSSSKPRAPAVGATVFRYERPVLTRPKAVEVLCRSDLLVGIVQVLQRGGENNLHAHTNLDGFWFVLSGRVRFYTTDDHVIAELGPQEGILIPRHFPYWFESVGDEQAEILQVEAAETPLMSDRDIMDGRIDYQPRRGRLAELEAEATGAGDD